jgi:hypothetical protein
MSVELEENDLILDEEESIVESDDSDETSEPVEPVDKKKKKKEDDAEDDAEMQESIARMFEGSDLSEEFKTKTVAIFEAAVQEKITAVKAELQEEFESELQEQVDATVEDLVEKVDQYLEYVVESWMEDNAVEIESNIKVEVAESLLDGIKGLVTEHNLDIDDEERDVVSELEEKLAESSSRYNDLVEEVIEVRQAKETADLEIAFKTISEDLTDTQVEKLRVLSEGVSHESIDEYVTKVEAIKANYFTESAPVIEDETDLLQEEVTEEAKPEYVDPAVSRYVDSISRSTNA